MNADALNSHFGLQAISKSRRLPSRRMFMQTAAAGALGMTTFAGCDNFEGIGDDPDGKSPMVMGGAFGFSIDLYSDNTFRLNADPRRVLLCGLFIGGAVPVAAVVLGNVALTLIDHANDENFVLSVASSGIIGLMGKAISPQLELDVNLDELRKAGSQRLEFSALESEMTFPIDVDSPVEILSDLEGTWRGAMPMGQIASLIFERTYGSSSIWIDSPGFAKPARYQIETTRSTIVDGISAQVFDGRVSGVLANDRFREERHTRLKLTCFDNESVLAETQYISWDGSGKEIHRCFWPFHMSRMS